MANRACNVCHHKLPLTDEYFRRDKSRKGGLGYSCRQCNSKQTVAYRKTPAGKENRRKSDRTPKGRLCQRRSDIKKHFGITIDDYDKMFEEQNGVCIICGNPPLRRALDIDHDHETGKIRGLLCSACNVTLGLVKDDVTILENMVNYLKKEKV